MLLLFFLLDDLSMLIPTDLLQRNKGNNRSERKESENKKCSKLLWINPDLIVSLR